MLFSIRKLQRVNHALEQETLGRIGNIFRSKAKPVLRLADISLTVLHLVVIGFNLFGWIWPRTRRAHLIVVAATAFCWLVPGIRFGIGYCPITDWQWQVKAKLGEHHLPPSFITWALQRLSGYRFSDGLVNTVTAVLFALAAALSVYFNFFRKSRIATVRQREKAVASKHITPH